MKLPRKTLEQIVEYNRPSRPRGPWNHYVCPVCDDKTGHLGINLQTGAARCFRCGSTGSLYGRGNKRIVKLGKYYSSIHGEDISTIYKTKLEPESAATVDEYMRSRNVFLEASDNTWAYGMGWAKNCVVFLSRNSAGVVRYAQKRNTTYGSSRYEAWPNTDPVIDSVVCPILIITEGPMSALAVQQATGMVSRPIWGAMPSWPTICSIAESTVERVVVMFDPDPSGQRGSSRLCTALSMLGVRNSRVWYKPSEILEGKDPADVPPEVSADWVGRAL